MHFLPTALNFLISRCSSNFVSLFLKILKFGSSYVLPFRYQRLSLTKKCSSAVNLFKANFRSSALSCFFLKLSMILIMFFFNAKILLVSSQLVLDREKRPMFEICAERPKHWPPFEYPKRPCHDLENATAGNFLFL